MRENLAKNLGANPAPKLNHSASTLAPQPMPGWHLKVPARHLDKPLVLSISEIFPDIDICKILQG